MSPIRQTPPTPGAEHLDLIYEHLEAAKSNLEWAADSFRDGLFTEAKTQEEVMKVCNSIHYLKKDTNIDLVSTTPILLQPQTDNDIE